MEAININYTPSEADWAEVKAYNEAVSAAKKIALYEHFDARRWKEYFHYTPKVKG